MPWKWEIMFVPPVVYRKIVKLRDDDEITIETSVEKTKIKFVKSVISSGRKESKEA